MILSKTKLKEAAVANLNKQIQKLSDHNYLLQLTWRTQTEAYIKLYFGESSSQFAFIKRFSFTELDHGGIYLDKKQVIKAETFLKECIEFINNHGLYKEPRKNFLVDWNNQLLVGVILAAGTGLFFLGNWMGTNTRESSKMKLEQENIKLKDSLLIIHSSLK